MNTLRALLIPLLLAWPLSSPALSGDRDQPMNIEADRVELDDAAGVSTYQGNVRVTQGSMVLTGDRMTVHFRDGDITRVLVEGSPATYRQRPDGKDQDVVAQSERMEYRTRPRQVELVGKARVNQAGDVLRSERIVYDVDKDQVNAGSEAPDARVHITIQPRTRKDKPAPDTP
ncbi:MAG TPA: lipopolysaccharide transport periplasmic protein LptA [Gammaproteobacteria bacterium]|nr:lipopolysaccharide transport periplasmic protein LptA [Gammaproteobacteria bacterium]